MDEPNSLKSLENLENLDDVEFTCPFCDRTIEIFNEDLEFSINVHSKLDFHIKALFQKNDIGEDEEENSRVINRIFGNISENFEQNKKYLTVVHSQIYCNLCCYYITFNSSVLLVSKTVEEHLNSEMHVARLKVISEPNHEGSYLTEICKELQKQLKYIHVTKYLIEVNNKIHCNVCDCDICETSTDRTWLKCSIQSHMTGTHLENIFEGIKFLSECDDQITEFLEIKHERLVCMVCSLKLTVEDVGCTFSNVNEHLRGKKHLKNLSGGTNVQTLRTTKPGKKAQQDSDFVGTLLDEINLGNVLSCLPEELSVNRYYIFMNMNGKYFCQLCNCSINVDYDCVIQHTESKSHIQFIKEKCEINFKSTSVECADSITDAEWSLDGAFSESSLDQLSANSTSNVDVQSASVPKNTENKDYKDLQKLFQGSLPGIVEKNSGFIVKFKNDYKCSLCNACLKFDYKSNFVPHLNSLKHKQAIRKCAGLQPIKVKQKPSVKDKLQSESYADKVKSGEYLTLQTEKSCLEKNVLLSRKTLPELSVHNTSCSKFLSDLVSSKACDNNKAVVNLSTPELTNERNSAQMDPALSNSKVRSVDKCLKHFLPLEENRAFIENISDRQFLCTLSNCKFDVSGNADNEKESVITDNSKGSLTATVSCTKAKLNQEYTSKLEKNIETFLECMNTKPISCPQKSGIDDITDGIMGAQLATMSGVRVTSDYECLKQILHPYLSVEVEQNQAFIVKASDKLFLCILCNAKFPVIPSLIRFELSFRQHFNSKKHAAKIHFKKWNDICDSTTQFGHVVTKSIASNNILSDYECLKQLLHPDLPKEIEENQVFIEKSSDKQFVCTLCNAKFCLSNAENIAKDFSLHFKSKKHLSKKQNKKESVDLVRTQETLVPTVSSVETKISLNQSLLQLEKNVQTHVESTHVEKSAELANGNSDDKNNSAQFSYSKMNSTSSDNKVTSDYECLKEALVDLFPSLPKIIVENLMFLKKTSDTQFLCTLCEAKLPLSSKMLFCQHLETEKHKCNAEIEKIRKHMNLLFVKTSKSILTLLNTDEALSSSLNAEKSESFSDNPPLSEDISEPITSSKPDQSKPFSSKSLLEETEQFMKGYDQTPVDLSLLNSSIISDWNHLKETLKPYLPHKIEADTDFIVRNNNCLECTLCKSRIQMCTNFLDVICKHFSSIKHIKNVYIGFSMISLDLITSQIAHTSSGYNDTVQKLFYPLKTPDIVKENAIFLNKKKNSGKCFFCTLCNLKLAVSSSISDRINQFCQHLNSLEHSCKVAEQTKESDKSETYSVALQCS